MCGGLFWFGFFPGKGNISHSVRCLALGGEFGQEKKSYIYTSQNRKTSVLPLYTVHLQEKEIVVLHLGGGKGSSFVSTPQQEWKAGCKFRLFSMFSSIWFHMENRCRTTQGLMLSQHVLIVISGISENLKNVQHLVCVFNM